MVRAIEACDLLSINIGGDKSSTAFGIIEDDEIDEDIEVNIFTTTIDAFCTDIDFGEALVKLYIADNKVGAVEIEVMNGPDNEESKKGLLRAYVESNFGGLDLESAEWNGYKIWDIGPKQILYYNLKRSDGHIVEGVAVTTAEHYKTLVNDE
jgi:hypothetical protein